MSLFTTARSAVGVVTRHNDINIVFLLVTVIALMIIPLPTPVVDTLIGVNMALSFTILMMTMYVRTVLDFSVFPTLLLFTTLFRVGLNITTTRLILLQADAGEIIFTFGEFALGGNFVVGAVVFLILTIVQFLVIAKGAGPKSGRVSPSTPCPASRCPSTPTCAPESSTWRKRSAAASASVRKARCTAPWTAP